MKKLLIGITLLAVFLLAFAGLAIAEGEMTNSSADKPIYHVYGFDKPGEFPVNGTIYIDQIYGANAKAYQAVISREDGTLYQIANISRDTWSVGYTMDECGEYTLTMYSCAWPDNVATPTDLMPAATPTDLAPYGTAEETDLTPYRIAVSDPYAFRVTSLGPVLPGENPQVLSGYVPDEVPQGEILVVTPNWGNRVEIARANVYQVNSSGEETEDCLVYGEAYQGESLYLPTWQLVPGETYRTDVTLSTVGFDNVSQSFIFTVTENGQGVIDGWRWTLTEDLEIDTDTEMKVGVYYPGADRIKLTEYRDGMAWSESYGYNGSAFISVYNYDSCTVTYKAEASLRQGENSYTTIESVCPKTITIKESVLAPIPNLTSGYIQRIGEDLTFRFKVEEGTNYSGVIYDVGIYYWAGYNYRIVSNLVDQHPNTDIIIPWADLAIYNIQDGESLDITIRAHGPGYSRTWYNQSIYMIGTEDEDFTISVESLDVLAEPGHAIVYRNEPYEIQINGIPEGISEIDILNNMTWQSYALTESATQVYEMNGISSHENMPVVARYWTEPEGYCYSNCVLLTPIGQGILPDPLVSTNVDEEAGMIDRGESIKIRLDNLDEYQVSVSLSACIVKQTGNPNMSYGENNCVIQDENTVLRIATGMLPADENDYILKVWANDRNDKWDQSRAIEIPFTLREGIEQGTIRITAAAGDLEIEGDSSPLQVMTGEYYTVSVYAPGASRIILHEGNDYSDYISRDVRNTYVEYHSETYSAFRTNYYAEVFYPNENEPILSNTVTIQVIAPYGNLSDHFSVEMPLIIPLGEAFTVQLRNADEGSDLVPELLNASVVDQMPGMDYYETICYGESTDATSVTVSTKDRHQNNLLENEKRYQVWINAYKRGYNGLHAYKNLLVITPEQQQGVLTINGESNHVELLTGENFTVSVSGLPEGTTAVAVLQPGQDNIWSYYTVPEGETSYSCENAVSMPFSKTDIIAKYTTQAIDYNQDWSRINWEGYTNTVELSVSTRGPLSTPVVSTNLTETIEDNETKLSIEQGNSIIISLDNAEDYEDMGNVYLIGSIIKIENGVEIQKGYNSFWINSENKRIMISTAELPLQKDDYILRVRLKDYSYIWDQSAKIDIPFTVINNLNVGDIKITTFPAEPELYENYIVEVLSPGASSITVYSGDYETNWPYSTCDGYYCSIEVTQTNLIAQKFFAMAYYPDQEEPVRSEITVVPTKTPYGSFEDVLSVSVPSFVIPGESLTISFQDVNEETNLTPRNVIMSVHELNYNWRWGTSAWKQKSITIPAESTDGHSVFEEGKAYRVDIHAELQGYSSLDTKYIVYASASEQQGLLTINDESDQVDLQMGDKYEIEVSDLPEGVTAVSILHPDGVNWLYYPITDGSTSIRCNDSAYMTVEDIPVVARYTMQEIEEYPNWDDVTWEGFTNTVNVSIASLGILPTPGISTNLTEITEDDQTRLIAEWGEKIVITLENVEDYADFNSVRIYGSLNQIGNNGETYYINDYSARVDAEHSELHIFTGNLSNTSEYILRIWMMDDEYRWEQSASVEIPFSVFSNMQVGEIRISASATEVLSTEEYRIQVLAPGAEWIELYRGNDESYDLLGTSFDLCYECSFRNYYNSEEQFFALINYPDGGEPVRSDIVTVRTTAPYGNLNDKIYAEVPCMVKPGEPFTVEVKTIDAEEELIPDELYVTLYDSCDNWLWSKTVYNATSVTVPARNDNNVILLENGKNYRLYYSVYKKGYNSLEWIGREIYAVLPEMQQGILMVNGNSEQIELIARENYMVSVTGLPENVTAVCVPMPDRGNEWSYHAVTDGSTSISYDTYAEYPVSNSIIFAKFTTQEIGEYPNWDEVIWDGFTNSVNVTIICTHKETYEQIIWSEDSECEADNKFTHTHTGHGEKWKVCSCCGEKLELLEEVTSLTEGHSYSDGVCMVCGYECPHDPEDIVHNKYLNGECTYVDEYTHHVIGTYVEQDYCRCCGKWIGEAIETPVDQDESHHYNEWYWCDICGYQSGEEHYLNVTCDWEADSLIPVEPHGSKLLSVINAESDLNDVFTYQWYLWDGNDYDPIDNATDEVYEIQDITYKTNGYVRVSDGYTYRDIYFTLYIVNGLTANAQNNQNDITVQPGEAATLNVVASCNNGELTYQWYEYCDEYGGQIIENAIDASYITEPIVEYKRYYCRINDMYGNDPVDIWFYIHIDNGFTAYAENNQTNITVQPEETATLNVVASCNNGELTYQWYEYSDDYGRQTIENAVNASYITEPIAEYKRYICYVSDMYGNASDIWFYIHIDNGLTAYAENNQTDITVQPGETVTLNVVSSCNNGGLTYQWYEQIYYEENGVLSYSHDEAIENAVGSSYETEEITRYKSYYCYVQDEYGSYEYVRFYIYVDNGFTACAENNLNDITVPFGETATLNVVASCNNGGLTYQWSRYIQYEENGSWYGYEENIDNANSSSYETEEITENSTYHCRVTDEYGSTTTVHFRVHVDSGLTISVQDNQSMFTVQPGETVTMSVVASCNAGGLRYQWYKRIRYVEAGEWYSREEIVENATEPSYTTDGIMSYTEYTCYACDDFGIGKGLTFYIYLDSKLTAEPDGAYVFHVSEAPVTLAVHASNLLIESQFSYMWYDPYNNPIASTTEGTYTLTNPEVGTYYCDVSDENQCQRVWFRVTDGVCVQACGDQYYWVKPDETVTLRVAAWNEEHDITYQWYENDTIIEGATEATYTYSAGHNKSFKCVVTGTGVNDTVWFEVRISNSFSTGETSSKVVMLQPGDSIQLMRNVTSTYDKDLTFSWYQDNWAMAIPDETTSTLTVASEGKYTLVAADCYGNTESYVFWCVEGQPETISEGAIVRRAENRDWSIYQFVPAKTGIYQIETEGYVPIYRDGYFDGLYADNNVLGLDAGQVYYVVLNEMYSSFRYTLIQPEQAEYTITLQQGQNYRIPELYVNGYGYTVENSTSDNESVVYNDGYDFETLSAGTANLTVNYTSEMQRIYHITVVNASAFTLPDQLQTIEEDAFDGDTGIRFIRLGSNVQTVKSGAFANTGDITVIVENGNTTFENGVFTNANPLIICAAESNVAWYCNTNRIPYLYK